MAATMSRNINNITEITKLMDECKSMGIQTLGPDVNESSLKFSVNAAGDIRFGMGAVKGVGENAVACIIKERQENGPFKGIFDFVQRVNLSACNRKNIECLALSGAFDNFQEIKREQFFATNAKGESFCDQLVRYGNLYQTAKAEAANSLFGGFDSVEIATPDIPAAESWSDLERLDKERELVGIYLSAHPLDEYSVILEHVCSIHMDDLKNLPALANQEVTLGGIVTDLRKGYTKKGNPFGIAKIEDYSGPGEIPLFGQDWIDWGNHMQQGYFLFIHGKVQPKQWKQDEFELKINKIELLPDIKDEKIERITLSIGLDNLDETMLAELSTLIKESPGKAELHFIIKDQESLSQSSLYSKNTKVQVGKRLINYLKSNPAIEFKINE
jgi:DNA polymerase-3 subunit alpha